MLDGLPVSSPATTWAMLGRELSVRELVVVGDALVAIPRGRGGVPMVRLRKCTPTELEAVVHAGPRRGIDRLRAARLLVRAGSMSPPETELRLDLVDAGMPEPDLDVEIRDRSGHLLGISELVYPHARLAVEVEGDHHRTSRRQWDRDLAKYAAYAADGWEVVRVTSTHIRTGRAVVLVRDALSRRTATR